MTGRRATPPSGSDGSSSASADPAGTSAQRMPQGPSPRGDGPWSAVVAYGTGMMRVRAPGSTGSAYCAAVTVPRLLR